MFLRCSLVLLVVVCWGLVHNRQRLASHPGCFLYLSSFVCLAMPVAASAVSRSCHLYTPRPLTFHCCCGLFMHDSLAFLHQRVVPQGSGITIAASATRCAAAAVDCCCFITAAAGVLSMQPFPCCPPSRACGSTVPSAPHIMLLLVTAAAVAVDCCCSRTPMLCYSSSLWQSCALRTTNYTDVDCCYTDVDCC